MRIRSQLGAVVVVCLAALPMPSAAIQFELNNSIIEFDPGSDMCALDQSVSEFERVMLDWQHKANQGLNKVIGLFVNCDVLADLRDGKAAELGEYGLLLAPLGGRSSVKPVEGYTREQFITKMTNEMNQGISLDAGDISDRYFSAMDSRLRKALSGLDLSDFRMLGELYRDEAATYHGLLIKVKTGRSIDVMAGVSALTLVKGYALQYSLYRKFIDQSTIEHLTEVNKRLMNDLVTKNDASGTQIPNQAQFSPANSSGLGFLENVNWAGVALTGLIGGLAAGLIAGISMLRRRV